MQLAEERNVLNCLYFQYRHSIVNLHLVRIVYVYDNYVATYFYPVASIFHSAR